MLVDYAVGRIEVMNPVSIHRVSRFSLIRRESGGEFSGARIVNSRGRNRPIRRLHVAVTTSLITSADSFEVGRLIGSYGFMNVTSYSGLRSGDEFESTSDDIGRVKSQDIGEGGVKISDDSLSANYTKEEYHRVGLVEHLSHFVITFLHGAMKGLAIMHANDRPSCLEEGAILYEMCVLEPTATVSN
ncbi:hypothetical protein Bca4012_001052 [Brassica carinata]